VIPLWTIFVGMGLLVIAIAMLIVLLRRTRRIGDIHIPIDQVHTEMLRFKQQIIDRLDYIIDTPKRELHKGLDSIKSDVTRLSEQGKTHTITIDIPPDPDIHEKTVNSLNTLKCLGHDDWRRYPMSGGVTSYGFKGVAGYHYQDEVDALIREATLTPAQPPIDESPLTDEQGTWTKRLNKTLDISVRLFAAAGDPDEFAAAAAEMKAHISQPKPEQPNEKPIHESISDSYGFHVLQDNIDKIHPAFDSKEYPKPVRAIINANVRPKNMTVEEYISDREKVLEGVLRSRLPEGLSGKLHITRSSSFVKPMYYEIMVGYSPDMDTRSVPLSLIEKDTATPTTPPDPELIEDTAQEIVGEILGEFKPMPPLKDPLQTLLSNEICNAFSAPDEPVNEMTFSKMSTDAPTDRIVTLEVDLSDCPPVLELSEYLEDMRKLAVEKLSKAFSINDTDRIVITMADAPFSDIQIITASLVEEGDHVPVEESKQSVSETESEDDVLASKSSYIIHKHGKGYNEESDEFVESGANLDNATRFETYCQAVECLSNIIVEDAGYCGILGIQSTMLKSEPTEIKVNKTLIVE